MSCMSQERKEKAPPALLLIHCLGKQNRIGKSVRPVGSESQNFYFIETAEKGYTLPRISLLCEREFESMANRYLKKNLPSIFSMYGIDLRRMTRHDFTFCSYRT